jgi:hypothetical protein
MATTQVPNEVRLQHVWTVIVDTPDLLLILKALGGRLTEEEDQAAIDLGDRLTELRGRALIIAARDGERLLDVISQKRGEGNG